MLLRQPLTPSTPRTPVSATAGAGAVASTFSLFNSSVGSTLLAMPLSFSMMGWAGALMAFFGVTATGYLSNTFLVRVAVAEDCNSYDKIIERVLGA